jgi:hypothetical protein
MLLPIAPVSDNDEIATSDDRDDARGSLFAPWRRTVFAADVSAHNVRVCA